MSVQPKMFFFAPFWALLSYLIEAFVSKVTESEPILSFLPKIGPLEQLFNHVRINKITKFLKTSLGTK